MGLDLINKSQSADDQAAAASESGDVRHPRWWRRRRLWLLLSLIGLITFHAPILRGVVALLAVQQPLPGKVDAIFAEGGDSLLEESVERFGSGFCEEILIQERLQHRTDLLGITVPDHIALRNRLVDLDIPSDQITLIGNDGDHGEWRKYRRLGHWLRENPHASVVVLCDQLNTRREHFLAKRLLSSDEHRRVVINGLPHTTFDVNYWWKSRDGWKQVFNSSVSLTFTLLWKEEQVNLVSWDVGDYERQLIEHAIQQNEQATTSQ